MHHMVDWRAVRQSRRTRVLGALLDSVQGGRLEPG